MTKILPAFPDYPDETECPCISIPGHRDDVYLRGEWDSSESHTLYSAYCLYYHMHEGQVPREESAKRQAEELLRIVRTPIGTTPGKAVAMVLAAAVIVVLAITGWYGGKIAREHLAPQQPIRATFPIPGPIDSEPKGAPQSDTKLG